MFVADLFEAEASPIKKTLVIMPGGFHPFHQGHMSLYNSAVKAFPGADVFIASTDDRSSRPVPFVTKQKLSQYAGVPAGRFVQVKSPFQAKEITQHYDPATTALIFVRSDKDRNEPPVAGGNKKDGTPAYLQPYNKHPEPMSQHGYIAYLPTVKFSAGARGMTSASEIRAVWPTLSLKQQMALAQRLYPAVANDPRYVHDIVGIFNHNFTGLDEGWKSNVAGAALAGAMALGGNPAMAQSNNNMIANVLGAGLIGAHTAQALKNINRGSIQAELNQELINVVRGNSNGSELAQFAAQQSAQQDKEALRQQGGERRPLGRQAIDLNQQNESGVSHFVPRQTNTKDGYYKMLAYRYSKDPRSLSNKEKQELHDFLTQLKAIKEEGGVGVIASKKQANDPRYSMSLTKDVRPGQIQKNLQAFDLAETDREPYQQAIDQLENSRIEHLRDKIKDLALQLHSRKDIDPHYRAVLKSRIAELQDELASHYRVRS